MDQQNPFGTSSTPQFATAEYKSTAGEVCKSCNQPISGTYYRVNGALACDRCVGELKGQLPKDTHASFVRGIVFGIGGAILGLILYSVFGIVTGMVLGLVSLAVGYIVGKAIKTGSSGIGGRRYQIAAALLTYAAVSMSAIPMAIYQFAKEAKPRPAPVASSTPTASTRATTTPGDSDSTAGAGGSGEVSSPAISRVQKPGVLKILGTLIFVGLASPFLELQDPVHGAIGLIILFVGIRIAWRLTAGAQVDVLGPFQKSTAPAPLAT
jgi:hypothetical protein